MTATGTLISTGCVIFIHIPRCDKLDMCFGSSIQWIKSRVFVQSHHSTLLYGECWCWFFFVDSVTDVRCWVPANREHHHLPSEHSWCVLHPIVGERLCVPHFAFVDVVDILDANNHDIELIVAQVCRAIHHEQHQFDRVGDRPRLEDVASVHHS